MAVFQDRKVADAADVVPDKKGCMPCFGKKQKKTTFPSHTHDDVDKFATDDREADHKPLLHTHEDFEDFPVPPTTPPTKPPTIPSTLPSQRYASKNMVYGFGAVALIVLIVLIFPRRTHSQTGIEACEGKGYGRDHCYDVGCCSYYSNECWSAVGNAMCTDESNPYNMNCRGAWTLGEEHGSRNVRYFQFHSQSEAVEFSNRISVLSRVLWDPDCREHSQYGANPVAFRYIRRDFAHKMLGAGTEDKLPRYKELTAAQRGRTEHYDW